MQNLSWLTSRPIAHRGFHDKDAGVLENTPSATQAAIDNNFSIEVDLQETKDGRVIVFHDQHLDRLTEGEGQVIDYDLADLRKLSLRGSTDHLWSLEEVLEQVNGKVPLVIEIKSLNLKAGQHEFIKTIGNTLSAYIGPVAIKSFDQHMLRCMKGVAPQIPRGAISMTSFGYDKLERLTEHERKHISWMLHMAGTDPHFVSYYVKDLPADGTSFLREFYGLPIMTWTVRSKEDRINAAKYADQIVFEGFNPDKDPI
ncbi:glycerophosphodiester phosphodiesterase family protein [Pseudovibrio sp. Tun.PSC04-5.I4]|uniref:glycerophosphodiester phosphodiesterase family protein n=1 Tax=Pseudovibrio sp. Tun.PSC04-5.I4 TaxID=1798213 RepID=UPI000B87CCEF|nr:glycerophosphodiester phosphodiesterase family protein [Pseudovibrio sp. Tun.PSC04-5.I4]